MAAVAWLFMHIGPLRKERERERELKKQAEAASAADTAELTFPKNQRVMQCNFEGGGHGLLFDRSSAGSLAPGPSSLASVETENRAYDEG